MSLSFYIISKTAVEGQIGKAQAKGGTDDIYEYRKTAKHEVKEKRWLAKWDENGRFFVL